MIDDWLVMGLDRLVAVLMQRAREQRKPDQFGCKLVCIAAALRTGSERMPTAD